MGVGFGLWVAVGCLPGLLVAGFGESVGDGFALFGGEFAGCASDAAGCAEVACGYAVLDFFAVDALVGGAVDDFDSSVVEVGDFVEGADVYGAAGPDVYPAVAGF